MKSLSLLSGSRRTAPRAAEPIPARPHLETLEDRVVPSVLDLTPAGASGTINGALFQQADPQPTGCGVIHDFLRIQGKSSSGVEQGYNTDARPLQFDEKKSPTFTRSLPLNQIPVVSINGVAYDEFLLGVNQQASQPLLSLDELRLYVGNAPNLSGYDTSTGTLAGLAPVYDMSAGGGNSVLLNAGLSSGNGSGDMFLYVRNDVLTAGGGSYLYLYSKFGVNQPANGGFEQWATRGAPVAPLSGYVYLDNNANGTFDSGDTGLSGVTVTLTGTHYLGQSVSLTTQTNAQGFYVFAGLLPGTYTLSEPQALPFKDGSSNAGNLGGTISTDMIANIVLPGGVAGTNYNFGELAPVIGGS